MTKPLRTSLTAMLALTTGLVADPIALHPDNPHYFLWRGKPTVIVTSGEHYGAVLNPEFDYAKYLPALAADGLNYTRIFSGAYVEPQGAFNIARNTLAPEAGKFLCPWARSDQAGYAHGGNKFDLSKWDELYFKRLKDFVTLAGKQGVVVEVSLFCPMYEDMQWKLSPMNQSNNINQVGAIAGHAVHTMEHHGGLLPFQEALVRKIVTELNPCDNVIFEICNEPYFGGVTMDWQHHIADVIVATEQAMPQQHLIAQNIANNTAKITAPHPAVSIFNFHYATPPDAVGTNYHLNKVIGDDETGFKGTADAPYLTEAWEFLLAGGGLFNNLDYSFTAGHEDGTFVYPNTQPGGGNPGFRKQLKVLREFMDSVDFIHMKPDTSFIKGGISPQGGVQALVAPGKAMALYLRVAEPVAKALKVELTAGNWQVQWVDPKTGKLLGSEEVAGGGVREVKLPAYQGAIAGRLKLQSAATK